MMNKEQALEYGRAHGCRYLVYNSVGGLLGGFNNLTDAENCRDRWQESYDADAWNNDMKVKVQVVEVDLRE